MLTDQILIKIEGLYKFSTNTLSKFKLRVTYQEQHVTINYCLHKRTVYYILTSEKVLISRSLNRFQKSSFHVRQLKSLTKILHRLWCFKGSSLSTVNFRRLQSRFNMKNYSLFYCQFATPMKNILNL